MIAERIAALSLHDPHHAVLCGGSAVQVWVGRERYLRARSQATEYVSDIDLVVSPENLSRLVTHPVINLIKHHHVGDMSDTRYDSYNDEHKKYDIWLQWREIDRGFVYLDELLTHSVWQQDIGCMVLSKDYLIDQRQRSIAYYEAKSVLTMKEQERLTKDRADLDALTSA